MSDDRLQVDADISRPVRTAEDRPGGAAFRTFSIIIFIVGALVAALVSWWLPLTFRPSLLWVAPLLAVAFLVAERIGMNVDVRGEVSWTISFTEIPMVIGLLVAPFQVVLVAHVVAGVATLLSRKLFDRALYNAGVFMIEAASAFAIAHAIAGLVAPGPGWVGAFIGVLAVPLSSTLLAVVAIRMLGRRMRLSSVGRLVCRVLVVGLLNASLGVTGYEIIMHSPWGWPLVILVSVGVLALYFAYSGLLREQRDLEALADVSLMVVRSGQHIARPKGK